MLECCQVTFAMRTAKQVSDRFRVAGGLYVHGFTDVDAVMEDCS